MEPQRIKRNHSVGIIVVITVVVSLFAGGWLGYSRGYSTLSTRLDLLQDQLSTLQDQTTNLQPTPNITYQSVTYLLGDNVSLAQVYEQVKASVVVVRGIIVQYDFRGRAYYTLVQGTGFAYNVTGERVILTNHHVVSSATSITVTFVTGKGYAASVLGSDPYSDLAVLTTDAPLEEYVPLTIVNSSALKVGDPVIAVGNPYGLTGSMSVGVVSSLGRNITEDATGGYPIANVIQTTTPLNPGNSGGPLLNYHGDVVGITTAIVADSQGVGFAIPSNAILREIEDLVAEGSYDEHPWLGVTGTDMTYEIAAAIDASITYGWLIDRVVAEGPADRAGLRGGTEQTLIAGEWVTIGGDLVVAINDVTITGIDDLSTYLEECTVPGQTINVRIMRHTQLMTLAVELGART
jgi:S1-C subfamily serine protease